MSEKIYNKLDVVFPMIGGGAGAASQTQQIMNYFPTWETITTTIIITVIGATVGYFAKLLLDRICKRK